MKRNTKTRAGIAALVYAMTNAVMFGAGLIFVLSVPGLRSHAWLGILAVVLASLIFCRPRRLVGGAAPARPLLAGPQRRPPRRGHPAHLTSCASPTGPRLPARRRHLRTRCERVTPQLPPSSLSLAAARCAAGRAAKRAT